MTLFAISDIKLFGFAACPGGVFSLSLDQSIFLKFAVIKSSISAMPSGKVINFTTFLHHIPYQYTEKYNGDVVEYSHTVLYIYAYMPTII